MTKEISIKWCADDVKECAKQYLDGILITDQEASDVLDYLYHKHDASIGINWEVIAITIQNVLEI